MIPNHVHKAVLMEVHDGDTFRALVHLDFFVRVVIDVRIHGYSAPELNQPGGPEARAILSSVLPSEVVLNSVYQLNPTSLQEEGNRSFTRWVCDVEGNGIDISAYMNTNAPKGGI